MSANNGGPAFPNEGGLKFALGNDLRKTLPSTGMTLRDYFVAKVIVPDDLTVSWGEAMVGPYPSYAGKDRIIWWASVYAAYRGVHADAMLLERKA